MWILKAAAILWAGFIVSALAVIILPGLGSALFALVAMGTALLLSARLALRSDPGE